MDMERSFTALLSLILEGIDPDRASANLVKHLAQIVRQLPEGYHPEPENLAIWVETIRNQTALVPHADPPQKANAWKKLLNSFEERWPLWGGDYCWGWYALSLAARQGDYPYVLRILNHSQAPSPEKLATRILPRLSKYPGESGAHPTGSYTLLGVLLERAEHDAYPLVQKLLDDGVDPNAPCAPGGVPPLLVAKTPAHIAPLESKSASFLATGKGEVVWLDPSRARRPQAIVDLNTQLEVWKERLKGEKEGLFHQIVTWFPELVDQVGEFIASRPSFPGEVRKIHTPARLLQDVGKCIDLDVGNPGPAGPSLMGAFSRGQLRASSVRATIRSMQNSEVEADWAFGLLPRTQLTNTILGRVFRVAIQPVFGVIWPRWHLGAEDEAK